MTYRLLDAFQATFEGARYQHRDSSLGDAVASYLYEDLFELGKSTKLSARIAAGERVMNAANRRRGVPARRGDGTFGELVPGAAVARVSGFKVARGEVATIEVGAEVKILAKAMMKQIDRVTSDLAGQAKHFQSKSGNPICIGIVGINDAAQYTSYEGNRKYRTGGTSKTGYHPAQESAKAEARVVTDVKAHFFELLVLRFRASNVRPFAFEWVNKRGVELDYAAALTRVSREYDSRF